MRAFFLTGSILLTVLILILAFQNLGAGLQGFAILFTEIKSPFFVVIGIATLGILTGIFYSGLVTAILRSGREEEEAPGNEW